MELSYFLSMMQYEVLKSFDFTSLLQDETKLPSESPIQLAIDSAEIEIPVIFNSSTKEFSNDIQEDSNDDLISVKSSIHLPFSTSIEKLKIERNKSKLKSDLTSQRKSTPKKDVNKKEEGETLIGDILNVEVANHNSKRDDSFDPNLIGKIKLVIKPVIK